MNRFARPNLEVLEDRVTPASLPAGFVESLVASGLDTPSAIHEASDGRLFIAERDGAVRVVENGVLQATPFVTVGTATNNGGGLLGVATDANFATNQYVYVFYTAYPDVFTGVPRVSRFTANGNVAAGTEAVLFQASGHNTRAGFHFGGAMNFGPDGYLYLASADHGEAGQAQTLFSTYGKVLRINADGTIPTDNPFVNETTGINQAIWARGFRNPYAMNFDAAGNLHVSDTNVGFGSHYEINQVQSGGNYGSPNVDGYGGAPMYIDPIYATTGYIGGGSFYHPTTPQFPSSAYDDDYFYAAFGSQIQHYDAATHNTYLFASDFAGASNTLTSSDGSLYVLTFDFNTQTGQLIRVEFTNDLTPNQKFVQTLYNDFLGRSGTLAEVNSWANQFGTLGIGGIVNGISRSPEAYGYRVDGLYDAILGRASDANGRAAWVNFLTTHSIESLTAKFLASDEFANRANALIGGSDVNANYVQALYQVLLDRTGSTEDVNSWLGQPRERIALGFLNSTEFRTGAVRTFYGDPTLTEPYQEYLDDLLRRPDAPDSAGVADWVNNGGDLFALEYGIAASLESFNRRSV